MTTTPTLREAAQQVLKALALTVPASDDEVIKFIADRNAAFDALQSALADDAMQRIHDANVALGLTYESDVCTQTQDKPAAPAEPVARSFLEYWHARWHETAALRDEFDRTHISEIAQQAWEAGRDTAQPAAPAEPVRQPHTYASTQATHCAGCGEHKHTPLRIDAMGGYVCLTCIDRTLCDLLRQPAAPAEPENYDQQALDLCPACGWRTLIPGDACLNCERDKPAPPAEPVAVPAGLSRSDAEFWLRHRAAIIDACRAEGYTIVTTAQGARLMRLGKVEAQAAPPAPARQEWQPIETAPRDGTHILATLDDSDTCYVICWVDPEKGIRRNLGPHVGWHIAWDGFRLAPRRITHWQPLPAAPSTAPAEGGAAAKPAPTSAVEDELSSACIECGGSGMRDSGGFYPWGEAALEPCDCEQAAPAEGGAA